MHVDTLAAFKRFLAMPGATLTLERHDFVPPSHRNHALMFKPRQVAVLQRNRVGLRVEGKPEPSWLELDRASSFRFDGQRVTVDLGDNGRFEHVMVYQLSVTPQEPAASAVA